MKAMSVTALQVGLDTGPPAPKTQAEPISPAVTGDDLVRAFNELRDELIGTLCYLLGNRDDAHDAAQETFMKCWRSQGEMAGVHNLRAFLFRVAMNTATDMRRSAWRRKAKPMGEADMYAAPQERSGADCLEDQEQVERLRHAIRTLRQEEQEVFLLRQNGDLTYEQIAEVRQMPVGTVKTQMRSALQKLRRILEEMPGEQP
jgi:RNA polymerase sigma-70 factor (ECF subfamily)